MENISKIYRLNERTYIIHESMKSRQEIEKNRKLCGQKLQNTNNSNKKHEIITVS